MILILILMFQFGFPQYFVVVLGLLVLIVVGTIIGMTQVTINMSVIKIKVVSLNLFPFCLEFSFSPIHHVRLNFQGLDKLKDPFLDTLSNYDESRQTIVELTWDQTQTDVSNLTFLPFSSSNLHFTSAYSYIYASLYCCLHPKLSKTFFTIIFFSVPLLWR